MTEWVIALGAIASILFVCAVTFGNSYNVVSEERRSLEEKNKVLKESFDCQRKANEELALVISRLTAENERLKSRVNVNDDAQRISEMSILLRLKQERIDELQMKLKQTRMLLRQRWEESRYGR